jgi:site-specific DNA recombinase
MFALGQAEMAKKLDVARIEKARRKEQTEDRRELEKRRIQDTIDQNRRGERKGRVIMPQHKEYAYEETSSKVRVAAYCRVSTQEEAQVGSFEMQVQHFKSVIESNPTYELVKIYQDEGISGTSISKRKGFQEMIEDATAGKIDLILTKSISRFGRNIVDILTTLQQLSDLNPPVAVNFESEGIFSSDGKNKMVISILSALAELESQQRSISVKEGIRYRMKEGLYKFSVRNTIGYYRDYSGVLRIEPAEAEIVQYIYESFLEGSSPQEIADSLTEQGFRSPMGKDAWRGSTIRSILKNEKYCGDVLYQKTRSVDFLTHKTVKNTTLPQWYWEGCHAAIIDKETWNKAQELLASRKYGKEHTPPAAMKKRPAIARVKNGALRGYFLLDMSWTREEREQFIKIMDSINSLDGNDDAERN